MKRFQIFSSRSIILVIVWNTLMNVYTYLILPIRAIDSNSGLDIVLDIEYVLLFLSFPLFGVLADIKTGRYLTIITGVRLMFLSWIIDGLALIVNLTFNLKPLYILLQSLSLFFHFIGYCSFESNILQFNIDQAVGASADELSAIIYWNFLATPIICSFIKIGQCLINRQIFFAVSYVLSGLAVSTVIVSDYLFKHCLDTTHHISNPIKLIAKVLNYARKNKYPRNRSALTYWEEDYPSRLDIGKEKYGGPFSEEQVENVKTTLRLITLFICIIGSIYANDIGWRSYFYPVAKDTVTYFISCFASNNSLTYLVTAVLLLLYELVVYPCCLKYIPSMLKRVGLGLIIAVSTPISHLIMLLIKDHFNIDSGIYEYIIPQILSAIYYILISPTLTEFMIAQSPQEMRGFMIGLSYTATGLGFAINIVYEHSFHCKAVHCQKVNFYLFKSLIVFIIFIVFLVLAKYYKLRVRENEVNIHMIAEEHYERYIEQEVEYRREMGLSFQSTT